MVSQLPGDAQGVDLFNEPPGVFRAGEFLMEGVEAEAVVDALVQDAAQFPVPFQHEDVPQTRLVGGHGCRQPRRTAADDDQIGVFHGCTSLSRARQQDRRAAGLGDFRQRNAQFTGQNGGDFGRTEAPLAPAHACPDPALYPVQAPCAGGPMNGVKNFALGDALAAADDAAIGGLALDETPSVPPEKACSGSKCFSGWGRNRIFPPVSGYFLRFLPPVLPLPGRWSDRGTRYRRSRYSRGASPGCKMPCSGRWARRPAKLVMVCRQGMSATEWAAFSRMLSRPSRVVAVRSGVILVRGRGSNQQIAVDRGRYQNALAIGAGQLENGGVYIISNGMVHEEIFSPPGDDFHIFPGGEAVNVPGMDPGSVDDRPGLDGHRGRFHGPEIAGPGKSRHRGIELQIPRRWRRRLPPAAMVRPKGQTMAPVGAYSPARTSSDRWRAPWPEGHPGRELPAPSTPFLQAVFQQSFQSVPLIRPGHQHQGAVPAVGEVQLFGQGFHGLKTRPRSILPSGSLPVRQSLRGRCRCWPCWCRSTRPPLFPEPECPAQIGTIPVQWRSR